MKNKIAKITIALVMLASVFGIVSNTLPMNVQAACETVDECQAEYDRIRDERAANQEKLAGLKNDYEGILSKIKIIRDNIANTQQQITVIEASIAALQDQITELEAQIEAKNETVRERMAAMQLKNKGNVYFDFIVNANSLNEMLSRSEAVEQITGADKELIHEIRLDKEKVEVAKADQVTKQDELVAQKDSLDTQYAEQDAARVELVASIHASEAAEQELSLAEDTSAQQLANISGKVPPSSGEFGLPTSSGVITAGFMDPDYGFSNDHLGTDIAWDYGTPIYSIGTGVVAEASSGSGSAYGNYVVMVYNKNGVDYAVMYGHLSTVQVYAGQVVGQGNQIGLMGSTGFSTGPHLHLEILRGINYFPASRGERLNYVINTKEVISYPGNSW